MQVSEVVFVLYIYFIYFSGGIACKSRLISTLRFSPPKQLVSAWREAMTGNTSSFVG